VTVFFALLNPILLALTVLYRASGEYHGVELADNFIVDVSSR